MTKDLPVVVDLSEPEPHILFLGEHISPSRVEYAEKTILKLSDPVGYAFDDITGLSEDVEEFDFEGNDEAGLTGRVKWWTHKDGTRYLHIDQGCDRISILAKNFSAFVRGLRQMAATAKRKE